MTRNTKILVGGLGVGLLGAVGLLAWVLGRSPAPRERTASAGGEDGNGPGRRDRRRRPGRGPLGVDQSADGEPGEVDDGWRRPGLDDRRRFERMRRGRHNVPEYTQPAPLDPSAEQLPPVDRDREAIRAFHDKIEKMTPDEIKGQVSGVASKYKGITVKDIDCSRRPCTVEITGDDPAQMAAYLDHLHRMYQGQLTGRMNMLPTEDGKEELSGRVMVGTPGPRPAPSELWERMSARERGDRNAFRRGFRNGPRGGQGEAAQQQGQAR